ncbi:MAG: hypothetical protein L6Q35_09625 [Phycisphaerales bacterium]|nr:hypothetical protein [Phycisphaerales bacterium]
MDRRSVLPLCVLVALMLCCQVKTERIAPVIINSTDEPVKVELMTQDLGRQREKTVISLAAGARLERAGVFVESMHPGQRPRARAQWRSSACEVSFSERAHTIEIIRHGEGITFRPVDAGSQEPAQ